MSNRQRFWTFITDKISPVALVIVIVVFVALAAGAFGYVLWSQKTIVNLSQQNYNLSKASLISQNNHHANTIKTQAQLKEALKAANTALAELQQAAAAIRFEGGVIIYQNTELKDDDQLIISAQQQGHALLAAVNGLAEQLTSAEERLEVVLPAAQAQINTYLQYLSCIGLNPTNTTICGAAPPLPSTAPKGAS